MPPRIALLAGATGLVGTQLTDVLLDDARFDRVVTVGRRPLDRTHPKLTQVTVDFAALDASALPEATDAFCALGTTIRRAGSQAAFRAVDHDAVLAFARASKARGVSRFYVVTAMGADAHAWSLYNRVKGEVEEALKSLGFASLVIARPAMLEGDRQESRPGERVGLAVTSALTPVLKLFGAQNIHGRTVALALRAAAHDPPDGARVLPSAELHALAARSS